MSNLQAMIRIVNVKVKGMETFSNLNEYTAICPFSIHCTLWGMPSPHVCLFLFICVGGGSSFVTWIPQRVIILNVLQMCVCVCVSCMRWCVCACVFRLLAGWMKYSWWHGGIGCWAKSGLTGLSRALCVLKQLAPSLSSSLCIKRWAEEEATDECDSVSVSA